MAQNADDEDWTGPLSPRVLRSRDEDLSTPAVLRLVKVALEVESVPAAMERSLGALMNSPGGFTYLVQLLDRTPRLNRTAHHLWTRISSPGVLRRVVGVEPGQGDDGDGAGAGADGPDFSSEYGLLRQLEAVIDEHGDDLDTPPVRHPEPVVRKAAVRHGAGRRSSRTPALRAGLRDEDAGVRSVALQCPEITRCPELAGAVAELARDEDQPLGLRETAVNVLSELDDPSALETLLDLAVDRGLVGRWVRWQWKLRDRGPLLLPALRALFFGRWRDRKEVRTLLELGRDSGDPRVRALIEARVRDGEEGAA